MSSSYDIELILALPHTPRRHIADELDCAQTKLPNIAAGHRF